MSKGTVTRSRTNMTHMLDGTNLKKKEELLETGNMFSKIGGGMAPKDFKNFL